MLIDFHPQASEELIEAANFYESCQNGLGTRFLDAVDEALIAVQTSPFIWKPDRLERRKYRIWKFPYQLIYRVEESRIYIKDTARV